MFKVGTKNLIINIAESDFRWKIGSILYSYTITIHWGVDK